MKLHLTIYRDAVRVEIEQDGRREGMNVWFRDEVSAISAAVEHVMMRSAMQSELRRLPPIAIESSYQLKDSGQRCATFKRGTRTKQGPLGRKFVMVPGSYGKSWLRPFVAYRSEAA